MMEIRKTIKVFLASSEELIDERDKFGNLIRRLDDRYLKRGIHVQLLRWEDLDPSYNNVRKQDEYNEWIRQCDIFVCLLHTRAGQYTLEELKVAQMENARRKEPKVMVYIRDLKDGEKATPDLVEFKQRLANESEHFWGHYSTSDKLHLDFVMFLLNREGDSDVMKVENGDVMFDGLPIASMDNLPFASENEGYKHIQVKLNLLHTEIKNTRLRVEKYPDDVDFRNELQDKLNQYNALKEQFLNHQKNLFATAKCISEKQLNRVSCELQIAISEFEAGHVEAANTILEEIKRKADCHIEQLERDRSLVHQDIKALQMKTKTLMADLSKPMEKRIELVHATFKKADEWARNSLLECNDYSSLLYDYGVFLYTFGKYEEAHNVLSRGSIMVEQVLGWGHPKMALFQIVIGRTYDEQGNYSNAITYYQNALNVQKRLFGATHPDIARTYNCIGVTYRKLGVYGTALELFHKAENIYDQMEEGDNPDSSECYINLGELYQESSDVDTALKYVRKALDNCLKIYGSEHPSTAKSIIALGKCFEKKGNYSEAEDYYQQALGVLESVYYCDHPQIKNCREDIRRVKLKLKYGGCLGFVVNKGCIGMCLLLFVIIIYLMRGCHEIRRLIDLF